VVLPCRDLSPDGVPITEVVFSPLVNTIDGRRFGSQAFVPTVEWLFKVGCAELGFR
jgi:hypothetical protein